MHNVAAANSNRRLTRPNDHTVRFALPRVMRLILLCLATIMLLVTLCLDAVIIIVWRIGALSPTMKTSDALQVISDSLVAIFCFLSIKKYCANTYLEVDLTTHRYEQREAIPIPWRSSIMDRLKYSLKCAILCKATSISGALTEDAAGIAVIRQSVIIAWKNEGHPEANLAMSLPRSKAEKLMNEYAAMLGLPALGILK